MQHAHSDSSIDLQLAFATLRVQATRIFAGGLACAAIAYGATWLITPTFTAKTVILSPQNQGPATAALSSLQGLSGLAGIAGIKSPADQYVAMMQSETLSNRIIQRFNLKSLYEKEFLIDTRRTLAQQVRIVANKKDNLITIEVDDHAPQRAADMANAYIDELRKLTNEIALTESQQRRVFFEEQLKETRNALTTSQLALQQAGIDPSAIKSDSKIAIETYARTKAQFEAAQARLNALRLTLADNAVEIQQLRAQLSTLSTQLARLEVPANELRSATYINAYRDYRYKEALFDIYARQFEAARLDEARDGTLVQVLDVASVPEVKSKPKRAAITLGAGIAGLLVTFLFFFLRRPRP
ncbi:Wzz/FepE/Etk N-terminal domain-containing protein [Nostoc sp. NIES-2111]